ncbi:MAG TPA: TIM barrel protein, partial [Desulfosarcina sp.]|nr:TIM barrel protein [Desulfosarcina sp.]
ALLRDLSIYAVELEYRLPAPAYHHLRPLLHSAGIAVASVHNFFPLPLEFVKSGGSGDLFSLADLRRDERLEAVKRTLQTIDHASDLEAQAVVLHCGRVAMAAETHVLYDRFRQEAALPPGIRQWLDGKLAERDRLKPAHLDALRFSLEKLATAAERRQVKLGLETRYHYHELPGPEDFAPLLEEFEGAPVGYWHDTGHAHVSERLGLVPEGRLLEMLADRLIGLHLHDAEGLEDHLPPGTGSIDFRGLAAGLDPKMPKVLELRPGTPPEAVREGLDYLEACFRKAAG